MTDAPVTVSPLFQSTQHSEQVCLHETGREPPQEESKFLFNQFFFLFVFVFGFGVNLLRNMCAIFTNNEDIFANKEVFISLL